MKKYSEYNLTLFINRVDLYFSKNKKGGAPLKKASIESLLSVFYRIWEEEITKKEKQEEFY